MKMGFDFGVPFGGDDYKCRTHKIIEKIFFVELGFDFGVEPFGGDLTMKIGYVLDVG